ncbi:MAG: pseudaminic acid biosynthesis-associated methylase [Rhodospirillaceae bacterium]
MTTPSATFQEDLWKGSFGDGYVDRNAVDPATLAGLTSCWAQMLRTMAGAPPKSILEVGANIGLNLRALRHLTGAAFHALEPNQKARERLIGDGVVEAANTLDGIASHIGLPDGAVDLAFTVGVLIHIHPDNLLASCREIHRVARKYIVCVEYFADRPTEVPYRGHQEALFKRDFGGFYLDNFPDLRVVDYGFFWSRMAPLDNSTWWVFEKKA